MSRLCLLLLCVLLVGVAHAGEPLHLLARVSVPGQPLRSFDIGFAAHGVYALADRSNHGVDLIDTRTLRPIGRIGGFAGPRSHGRGGPNGVVIDEHGRVWAGDGGSRVVVADVATRRVIATVSTGGTRRVDELALDARDHLLIAANNADKPPFVSLISTRQPFHVVARVVLAQATHGLEQPAWDPRTGLAYVSVPELDGVAAQGGIAVIDPRTATLRGIWGVQRCMPAGLALGPQGQLAAGCSDDAVAAGFGAHSLLLDTATGRVTRRFDEVGGSDEVWWDAALHAYLLAAVAEPGGPVLGVIDARRQRWSGNVPSGRHAHSVAGDAHGRVFVPVAAGGAECPRGCVEVFAR